MRSYQLSEFTHLASNEQYADIYVGEVVVAHIARVRVYDKDHCSEVTFYNRDRSKAYSQKLYRPLFFIENHARRLGLI